MSDQLVPPVEPAEPVAAAPAPAPAPTPEPASTSPWARDLEATFQDETVRSQVDSFLRGHVQPHVTRIEQEYAPARQLYTELNGDNHLQTYLGIAAEMYGNEVAEVLASTLADKFGEAEPAPAPAADEPTMTPEMKEAVEFVQAHKAEQLWQSEMGRVKTNAELGIEGHEHLFANFVVGAEGDFDEAAKRWSASDMPAYVAYLNDQAAAPAPTPAPAPAPPATLDGSASAPATPPVVPRASSLDEALDGALADMRAARQAPTPVGQV